MKKTEKADFNRLRLNFLELTNSTKLIGSDESEDISVTGSSAQISKFRWDQFFEDLIIPIFDIGR